MGFSDSLVPEEHSRKHPATGIQSPREQGSKGVRGSASRIENYREKSKGYRDSAFQEFAGPGMSLDILRG